MYSTLQLEELRKETLYIHVCKCLVHVSRTAVHAAAFSDHVECMQLLVSRGAATGLADNMGRTPLMMAAHFGHTNVVGMFYGIVY